MNTPLTPLKEGNLNEYLTLKKSVNLDMCKNANTQDLLAYRKRKDPATLLAILYQAIVDAQSSFNVSKPLSGDDCLLVAEKIIAKYPYESIYDILLALKNLELCRTQTKVEYRFDFQVVDSAIQEHLMQKYEI
jgi:hypothetical protein